MRSAVWSIVMAVTACSEASAAPDPAADKLAATFSPDVVGDLRLTSTTPGDYSMSLAMSFSKNPNMESIVEVSTDGAMTLNLSADGKATACIGAIHRTSSSGDGHYHEDHAAGGHRSSASYTLVGMAGRWSVVDGVTSIRFERSALNTCDTTAAVANPMLPALRCIATGATTKLPAGTLVCEASVQPTLSHLGMPMTKDKHVPMAAQVRGAPEGHDIVLAKAGVNVRVTDQVRGPTGMPGFSITEASVSIIETGYRAPRTSP